MNNIITQVRRALVGRVGTISQANGYRTNIGGAVRAGWFNEIVKSADVLGTGLVVIQRGKGRDPRGGPNGLISPTGFSVIGAVNAGLQGYEEAIEDIELDLLQCLVPQEGARLAWLPRGAGGVQVGAPEPFPPGDGLPAATVLIPIHISTIIEGNSR